jgi:hypothetical protein
MTLDEMIQFVEPQDPEEIINVTAGDLLKILFVVEAAVDLETWDNPSDGFDEAFSILNQCVTRLTTTMTVHEDDDDDDDAPF